MRIMKKKFFAFALALVLMMAMFVSPASAATKQDLVEAIRNDEILSNYEHVVNSIINQMDNFNFTSEQCDYLLEKFNEAKAIMAVEGDKGQSAHEYSEETVIAITDLVAEVVTELGYTYAYLPVEGNPLHPGDQVFQVYDANGHIVFEYDGDLVKHTDEVAVASNNGNIGAIIAIGAGVVLLAVAVFFAVKGKKSIADLEA